MTTVNSTHVWLDDKGVGWIDDTNIKVREIALDVIANGWSPREIQENYPDLSLAQIHSALAFYYDHKTQIDGEIEAGRKLARELEAGSQNYGITRRALELREKK